MESLTTDTFDAAVQSGVTVVDFWADWCQPCKMFGPVFERVSKKFEGKAKFVKVNSDDQYPLTEKHKVGSLPSVLLFKDGKYVDRKQGLVREADLEAWVHAALS